MQSKPRLHVALPTRLSLLSVLVLGLAGLVAFSTGSAASPTGFRAHESAKGKGQPKCGDTITADTTLKKDLVDCPNNGIVIGANEITLDLNGHMVDGDGTPAEGCDPEKEFCDTGVVNDGHDGVTVIHGSVREFDVGVVVGKARHNRLLSISSSANRFSGLGFFASTRSLMRNCSGSRSTSRENGTGMFLADSHGVRILHNSFRRNGDQGIFAPDSTHNLIKGNLLSHNRGGIELQKSSRNQVRRNRSVEDGIGVLVALGEARGNVIAGNRIVHPIRAGGADGQGIEVPRGSRNVIARNVITDASRNAITVGGEGVHQVGTVIRGNHISGAGEDGVTVGEQAERTLLLGNRVRRSRDDGFDVRSRTVKLTENLALGNGGLGIAAVRGVVDGGGNIARHNGDRRQCTHIACR